MAVLFTVISMFFTCVTDLCEKKSVSSRTDEALKTIVWYGIIDFAALLVLLVFGLDESSMLPHEFISQKPMILLPPILSSVCFLTALLSYKYVGVSVRNTFANTDGVFYILLLIIFYATTGNAQFATRLFTSGAIIGLALIIGATIIYPYIKDSEENTDKKEILSKTTKPALIMGISLAMISGFFDGFESMVSSVLIGDDVVDSIAYLFSFAFFQLIFSIMAWIYLLIKDKRPYNPFKKTEKWRIIGQTFSAIADILYIFAISEDALIGIILWTAFPVLDIVGARIFMKERLNKLQYVVLSMLIIGSIIISLT